MHYGDMTFLTGAIIGVLGNLLWQIASISEFRNSRKCWPWQDDRLGFTKPSFMYTVFAKLICAFLFTGFAAYTNQISGPWAAGITGMVADSIILMAATKAKKGYMK